MRKTLLIFISLLLVSCSSPTSSENKTDNVNINVALGIPTDSDTTDDYLIFRSQYVLSYNKNRNVANWVSWELNKDWFGDVSRYSGNFITDTTLPAGYYRVKHSDYTNSGFDRGHLVMSEERTKTVEDNKATFILTNILPQTPDLNRGVWLNFENYCNSLALDDNKELFIIAGGIFHSQNSINGLVAIPDSCFKIVVVLERGKGLKDISTSTEVIAVVMPNIDGVRSESWEKYKTTVRRVENSTGYNFLSSVPIDIQNVIETK